MENSLHGLLTCLFIHGFKSLYPVKSYYTEQRVECQFDITAEHIIFVGPDLGES